MNKLKFNILSTVSSLICLIALNSSNSASTLFVYQPKVPKKLRK